MYILKYCHRKLVFVYLKAHAEISLNKLRISLHLVRPSSLMYAVYSRESLKHSKDIRIAINKWESVSGMLKG